MVADVDGEGRPADSRAIAVAKVAVHFLQGTLADLESEGRPLTLRRGRALSYEDLVIEMAGAPKPLRCGVLEANEGVEVVLEHAASAPLQRPESPRLLREAAAAAGDDGYVVLRSLGREINISGSVMQDLVRDYRFMSPFTIARGVVEESKGSGGAAWTLSVGPPGRIATSVDELGLPPDADAIIQALIRETTGEE